MSNWKILGLLIAAPLMGVAYVVFLPTVGFYLVGKFMVEKLVEIGKLVFSPKAHLRY